MRGLTILLIGASLAIPSCQRLEHVIAEEHGPAWEHHEEAHAEPIEGVERFTADVPVVAAHDGDFFVAARSPVLEQAPCSQCHGKGEVRKPEDSPRPAHWMITKTHGDATELTCETCHSKEKPETLVTVHGAEVDLDHAYELCGTCHFEQLRDWKGGAHGKRLGAWSGDRVVQSCTGCHDPHDPSFPVRMPATFTPPPDQPTDNDQPLGENE
ncbi:MAG: hypothetical protein R3338_06395 [Thermoanaerobaculia bacterium]|nr:hypothetical protein [Thermoanaerobaculia bacterium]